MNTYQTKGEVMLHVATPTKLKQIRESLGISQDALARRTRSISVSTVVRLERGAHAARYDTAMQILDAINAVLQEQGKSKIVLEDLELRLY